MRYHTFSLRDVQCLAVNLECVTVSAILGHFLHVPSIIIAVLIFTFLIVP